MFRKIEFILLLVAQVSCTSLSTDQKIPFPVNPNASKEAKELLKKLYTIRGSAHLFGHQDDLAYGYSWSYEAFRSDVKDVTGSYPAVFGYDLGHLEIPNSTKNIDGVPRDSIRNYIKFGHELGAVISLSWHIKNPIFDKYDDWKNENTVEKLLPNGTHHTVLIERLNNLADFLSSLKDKNGTLIPIIFRPWHEHNGDWFWWGKTKCTPEQYVELWQFTFNYLTQTKKLNQLLFANSPDRSRTNIDNFESDYLYAYPGDKFLDILGLDNYWDVGHVANSIPRDSQQINFIESLSQLSDIAQKKNKIAALTETGNETVKEVSWYSNSLLAGLKANKKTKQIVYSLVWRNATKKHEDREHYYTPYHGHRAENDFKSFKNDSFIHFINE